MADGPSPLANIIPRVRAALGHAPAVVAEPPTPPAASLRHIDFVAYAEDCVLEGRLRLDADRLTDLLNGRTEVELEDVLVSDLEGGAAIELRTLALSRDDILVIHATGPRGRSEQRRRTRQHPIVAKLGPYEVRGYVHTLPGSDPISSLRRRRPIVPLTDARIEYVSGAERRTRRVDTVLINRDLADWIIPGADEDDVMPELDIPSVAGDPMVKDFTWAVLSAEETGAAQPADGDARDDAPPGIAGAA